MHDTAPPLGDLYRPHLDLLRSEIDRIDAEIVALIADRFVASRKIGALKAANGLEAVDVQREVQVFDEREQLAIERGAPPHIVDAMYRLIVTEVVSEHEALRREDHRDPAGIGMALRSSPPESQPPTAREPIRPPS